MKRIENLTRPLAVIDCGGSDGGAATVRLVSLAIARFEPDGATPGVLGREPGDGDQRGLDRGARHPRRGTS